MLEVAPIEGKGRGVIATQAIPRGTLLSTCPILLIPNGSLDDTPLKNHYWTHDGQDILSLGIQTLCNHADDPNCVSILYNNTDLLISIKEIKKGEEAVLNYYDFEE